MAANRKEYINPRDFYDKLDDTFEHDPETGIIRRRSDHRIIEGESLRIQIRGQRRNINLNKFVWWLYTSEIQDRNIHPIDGDYRNRRFSNLELASTAKERFEAKRQEWLDWCYLSEEQRKAYLASGNPQPQPPC